MRFLATVALATTFFVSNAIAADRVSTLVPGKPAGVKHAQSHDNTMMILVGVGIVGAGIALAVGGSSRAPTSAPAVTTTTTTSTTTT